jgi:16S rRNA (cytidine1402-2'-O)-methyltransferase
MVSDAGTPLISDPGQRLVDQVWKAGLRVVPVPGPSALLAALGAAGLDTSIFTFFGFLPRAGSARAEVLRRLSAMQWTTVLYEAPARLCRTLDDLAAAGAAGRRAVVARELTKRFEEFRRGTVEELAAYYRSMPPRGEVVIILQAREEEMQYDQMKIRDRVAELRREGRTARDITAALSREFGIARNVAYRLAQES